MGDTTILLKKTEVLVLHSARDAYHICSGTVIVYIVPWNAKEQQAGKRVKLCEVEAEKTIPGFAWRDQDYQEWRFAFVSKSEEAELQTVENGATLVLKKRFLSGAGIETFDLEGYEGSLTEYYNERKLNDEVFIQRGEKNNPKVAQDAYNVIASAVGGEDYVIGGNASELYNVLQYACGKCGIRIDSMSRLEEVCSEMSLMEIARVSRINCREIKWEKDWNKGDCGVLIGMLDEHYVALIPYGRGRYKIWSNETKQLEKLSDKVAEQIAPTAFVIRRSLPRRALTRRDMIAFVKASVRTSDIVFLLLISAVSTLIGVLIPKLNQLIYDEYIPMGAENVLIQMCLVIATFMIGNVFISLVQKLQELRVPGRVGYELQDAVYQRTFELPESFFRKQGSADLGQRLIGFGGIANQIVSLILVNGFMLLMSVIYLIQMFTYSGKLTAAGSAMVVVYALVVYFLSKSTMKYKRSIAENNGEAAAKLYQFLSGVDKIRMAGAEEHALLEYTLPVAREQKFGIRANRINGWVSILTDIGSVIFSMVLYYMMVKSNLKLSTGSFLAFNTAFGSLVGGVMQFVKALVSYNELKPQIERVKPFVETSLDAEENQDVVSELSGELSVEHVSFAYNETQGNVLNDISLHIKPGEYVAIVGQSGCGKSTLLKLLLGFESPTKGIISYDGKNLDSLDKHMLRRKMGVVLQNGKLISGSIFENITITTPHAKMEDVMKVIEDVGLKNDIAAMPMGVHTVLSESGNTISGGQQQRILIARAIFHNPSILFFDEATSALDNITQSMVCESLEKRHMTRLVIAHRLSTVQNCDRIIVIDRGTVVEEGNYESLMRNKGLFYQMASRQIAE